MIRSPLLTNYIHIVYWNCDHLTRDKVDQLGITARTVKPALILLTEIWKRVSANGAAPLNPYIADYCWHSLSPPDSPGVGMFIRDDLDAAIVTNPCHTSAPPTVEAELIWISIRHNAHTNTHLGLLYRSPSYHSNATWSYIRDSIVAMLEITPNVILVGDFNARHSDFGDRICSPDGSKASEAVLGTGLHNLNMTFIPNQSTYCTGSVLDLVFASSSAQVQHISVDKRLNLVSDHFPLSLYLSALDPIVHPPTPATTHRTWNIGKADWSSFTKCLSSLFSTPFQSSSVGSQHIDDLWSHLKFGLIRSAETHVGYKTIKPNRKQWWSSHPDHTTSSIAILSAYRIAHRDLYRSARRRTVPSLIAALRATRSRWRKHRSDSISHAWQQTCNNITDDQQCKKHLWNCFKRTLPSDFIPVHSISAPVNSPVDPINTLAGYFAQTCTMHTGDFDPFTHFDIQTFHNNLPDHMHSFHDAPFTTDELRTARSLINTNSACGPDNIHPLFLKHAPDTFFDLLLTLINLTWTHGYMPLDWTSANICPLYKGKGDKSLPTSFRPISLTSLVVKMVERLILIRIHDHLLQQLSPMQSGFRPGFCTYDNIYRLLSASTDALQSRSHLPCVFIDLKKAFDSVWIDALLYKLHKFGVHGRAWHWIRAFLSNRRLRVSQSGQQSEWFDITAGVPQGSVLAPTLFLVFINDLAESLHHDTVSAMYADDISLDTLAFLGQAGYASLQSSLNACATWAYRWKMVFSEEKTNVVCFRRGIRSPLTCALTMGDLFAIKEVSHYTFLGLTLQHNLRWNIHFSNTIKKIRKSSYMISRIIRPTGPPSPRTIRLFVQAIIIAQYSYALMFWRPTLAQLTAIQRAVIGPLRKVLQLPRCTSHQAIFADFGILPPTHQRQAQLLAYYRRAHQMEQFYPENPVYASIRSNSAPKPASASINQRDFSPAAELHTLQELFDYDLRTATQAPKLILLQSQLAAYKASSPSTSSTGLRTIKSDPGCSLYIKHSTKQQACLFARYRHDFARFAQSTMMYRITANNPVPQDILCPSCNAPADDRDHALTACSSYSAARCTANAALSQQLIPTANLRNYLADFTTADISATALRTPATIRFVLSIIYTFIKHIQTIRFPLVSDTFDPP